MATRLGFLLDVDNTLIENDRVKEDMERRTREFLGDAKARRFWEIYEEVRRECDFVDFPATLERFAEEFPSEPRFGDVAGRLLCYPYQEYLYPGALEAIAHLRTLGEVAIVSDGDRVFQPSKIARSGLSAAVDYRVLVTTHKEEEFGEVERRFPAERYVVIDDKPSILDALKERLRDRIVAVHVRQGRYAEDSMKYSDSALQLDSVGALTKLDLGAFAAVR